MSVSTFTPSGEGLSEGEIRRFSSLVSKAIVRLKCKLFDDEEGEIVKLCSTGFVCNDKGDILSAARGFPKKHYDVKMAYFGEKFQKAKVVLDYEMDTALVEPERRRDNSPFLEPVFELPPVGKWLFTIAHAGRVPYVFYDGKCTSAPRSVRELNAELLVPIIFPNKFKFIQVGGMNVYESACGAPIMNNTGHVLGIYSFYVNNLDYVIPSSYIRHLNADFLDLMNETDEEILEDMLVYEVPDDIEAPWLNSNSQNFNTKAAVFRETSSMVKMRDRFRPVTTQGQSAEKLDIDSSGIASTDVSRVREVIENMTSIFEAYSGVNTSSREKPEGLETLKAESVKRSADQLTLQELGGDEMDMLGNAGPFDYSRVERGIDQAFKKLRTYYEG